MRYWTTKEGCPYLSFIVSSQMYIKGFSKIYQELKNGSFGRLPVYLFTLIIPSKMIGGVF
ncbi:hypothetical protein D3H55_13505 [Bacillus salacetis]|uniref:Uncharacterized protein n=1 Tax=Bacillus salacetis TaxID=2315464 RepID=A0A3A1QVN0_9BACI|nr:hypothetical protein [Bacillus salacetis]RIW32287.1 hypothetical protein D3H55_13505 [Bacillus salacetis]